MNNIYSCVGPSSSASLQQSTDYFKARYQRKGLVKSSTEQDPWPPINAKLFTTLTLVHQKIKQLQVKEDTVTVAEIRTKGDIHKIPEVTSSVKLDSIHQIFTPITSDDQCPMRILIEGHPGIGKTTLAKEICLQWANNRLLASDKLLFLLMLRDPNVQEIFSTKELVKYALPAYHRKLVLSYLHTSNGANVTFIIDGFDELGKEVHCKTFFWKLIEGDTLPNARIVVTSRPSASSCLHPYVDRRIEIFGFEKSSKEQYVNDALKDSSKLETLKRHFLLYPNIKAICYVPLNMAIIVYLCLAGILPSTASEMFESFILQTLRHHLIRIKKITVKDQCKKMEDLPRPVQKEVQLLQKVAFDGLLQDRIVFSMDDLPVLCRNSPNCNGLLQSVQCYCSDEIDSPTKFFNFVHLGIQEYFAAKYVATLTKGKVFKLRKESFLVCDNKRDPDPYSNSVRFSNVWIMHCGITRGKSKSLVHYLTRRTLPSHIRHLKSLNQRLVHRQASPKLRMHPSRSTQSNGFDNYYFCDFDFLPGVSSPQMHADGECNGVYQSIKCPQTSPRDRRFLIFFQRLTHYIYHLFHQSNHQDPQAISQEILNDPLKVLYLFQCFKEAQNDKLCNTLSKSFKGDEIRHHTLLPHQVVSLGFFLSNSRRNWMELNLCECKIGDHGMNLLHHYLCEEKSGKLVIKTVILNLNDLTGVSSPLLGDIITYVQLHTLQLSCNNISSMKDISIAVTNSKTIKVLLMEANDLVVQEASAISDMLTSLEEINIRYNKLGDNGAVILSKGIIKSNTLRVLDITENDITATGATAIAESLQHNTSLEVLNMSNNAIGEDGAIEFGCAITNNKMLKHLHLGDCKITATGVMAIANGLLHNNSLEVLYLSNNAISLDGATAIGYAITTNRRLRILSLSGCKVSVGSEAYEEPTMVIIRSLHHNDTITVLYPPEDVQHDDSGKEICNKTPCYKNDMNRELEIINSRRKECNLPELNVFLNYFY